MSLQRGSYGIEFDGRQGSPLRKLWVLLAGLPVLAAALMFFRGCSGVPARVPEDGESVGQTRYRSMEVETERERPSLFRHFLNLGGRKKSSLQSRLRICLILQHLSERLLLCLRGLCRHSRKKSSVSWHR